MSGPPALHDVTGQVRLDDAAAVADAVVGILADGAGPGGAAILRASFAFVQRVFDGHEPRWLACDLPYHDQRHSLDAALAMARLVDGYRRDGGVLGPELALTGVVLALLHDTGFLRSTAERSLRGPQLAPVHEARSVAFAGDFLRTTPLAAHAPLASLIMTTRVAQAPAPWLEGRDPSVAAIGRMLGSADLLCQIADTRYLARCFHHLYPELVLGGGDRKRMPDGRVEVLFRDARDLVACTPAFHDHVARPRLVRDFANVAQHLAAHFGGIDPYATSIRANLDKCEQIVGRQRWDLLGTPPPTTTRDLDAAYGGMPVQAGT
jgi:hypothetical protein